MRSVGERDPAVSERRRRVGFSGPRRPEIFQAAVAVAMAPMFWVQGSLWRQEFTWMLHISLALAVLGIVVGVILNRLWRDDLKAVPVAYRAGHAIITLAIGIGSLVFIAKGPLAVIPGTLVAASVLAVSVVTWIVIGPAFQPMKNLPTPASPADTSGKNS